MGSRETAFERWHLGDLVIDAEARRILRGAETIDLPQLSFRFLLALVKAAPGVLSIDELMERVWPGIFVNSETVTQRAKLLRDALGDDPKNPRYFTVRRGVGYQLIPTPVLIGPENRKAGSAWHGKRLLAALALATCAPLPFAGFAVWHGGQEQLAAASVRIAVLPFDNLSSDPADAFIARSIPEIVLNRLSTARGLTVISRDSALLSQKPTDSASDVAARLNVAYVVKGSVQRTGSVLRVTCFVVDAVNGARLWSEQFDWPVDRLYALQDRIAERVAASLETRTGSLGALAPAAKSIHDADAYAAYLKGKSLLGRFTVAETDVAAAQFERAVRLDAAFPEAMIALFDARMQAADLRKDDLAPVRARYQVLLDKALRMLPASGEGLFARAMWSNLPRAERLDLFRRAAQLDPSNSRGLTAFAEFLEWGDTTRDNADHSEGQHLMDRVLSIDPLSPRARFWAVQRQLGALTPQQLEAEQAKALQLDPENYPLATRYANRKWMFHGESADAIAMLERVIAGDPQNPWGLHIITAYYFDANDPASARAAAAMTPASRDSTRAILAQYSGNWQAAGQAALGPRGFLFNQYENWLWAESVRDQALHTGEFQRGAEAIASRFGFDLKGPRVSNLPQSTVAPALGQILLASGQQEAGTRLLAQTVQWIDQHPKYGITGVRRTRAAAMMLLGNRDAALSDLRVSIETGRDIRFWWYVTMRDPVWLPVHDDPRFKAIVELCRSLAAAQRARLDELRRAGKISNRLIAAGR